MKCCRPNSSNSKPAGAAGQGERAFNLDKAERTPTAAFFPYPPSRCPKQSQRKGLLPMQESRHRKATEMSDEEIQEKSLAVATASLEGKAAVERASLIHQHIGRREMTDMIIETLKPDAADEVKVAMEQVKASEASSTEDRGKREGKSTSLGTMPDSPSKQLPDQISFFSGNPSVEIVHGIMHLYKTNKMTSLKEDVRRSAMLCVLTVPATMTSHDLMKFVASFYDVIEHMKIIRDSTPNQYMALIKFSTQADADSFYMACNGRQFNSIEEDVCQLVYVERAEVFKSEDGASLPVMDLTELPKCTVCLERMDESVNGILTTLCNHSFHSQCLQRWEDTTCPVCRYCQTPEPVEENKCFECGVQENLWICLICGHIGCGRYVSRHAYKHFEETQHTYAMQLTNHRVWDYAGDNYVHRLVASKTDGKLVQYECEGEVCQEEKIDALQLEYSYLLTSQLESQRIYWENKIVRIEKDTAEEINNMKSKFKETIEKCDSLEQRLNDLLKEKQSLERKCTQLSAKVCKLTTELKEEQEMNKCLRANQLLLQNKLKEEEKLLKETCEQKDLQITEVQEQLRDVMFYLETQQKINHLPVEARQEIQDGQINIAMASASSPAGAAGKPLARKGRGKRGK
ncbi:BRCA1-associated protein isoform X1 [Anolis carolinensis]|uniref:BRCA1-associated protein isoform X1 n=1 Tax=Anolis carolinensis TaxID=28377 RepID=UPI0007DB7B2D|nr:PREDICTED: BRCA1-associated protein [Anolis carolinensis]|eukprot:XP_008118091.2 PREDICTED: BRCA1-associated protein [Anolis carolinensis]